LGRQELLIRFSDTNQYGLPRSIDEVELNLGGLVVHAFPHQVHTFTEVVVSLANPSANSQAAADGAKANAQVNRHASQRRWQSAKNRHSKHSLIRTAYFEEINTNARKLSGKVLILVLFVYSEPNLEILIILCTQNRKFNSALEKLLQQSMTFAPPQLTAGGWSGVSMTSSSEFQSMIVTGPHEHAHQLVIFQEPL
jgi:hypothetical protein